MKKEYFVPEVDVIEIETSYLLAESESEGGSGDFGGEGVEGDEPILGRTRFADLLFNHYLKHQLMRKNGDFVFLRPACLPWATPTWAATSWP